MLLTESAEERVSYMKERNWCLIKRGKGKNAEIIYYSLKDYFTKKYMSHRSARTTSENEAKKVAARAYAQYLAGLNLQQITSQMSVIAFIDFFYDETRSLWIKAKRDHDENALKSDHLRTMYSYFNRYVKKYLGPDVILADITPYMLDIIQQRLFTDNKHLKPQTINAIFSSLTHPLRCAAHKWIIPRDPTEGLKCYKPDRATVGVFTQSEVDKLLSLRWKNETGKLFFLLAISTGMREGEILGLRKEDLGFQEDENGGIYVVHVNHSWSKTHGLKCPKNGKTRSVPIPAWLWTQLQLRVGEDAYGDAFVLSSRSGMPVSEKMPRVALSNALEAIGVSREQQKSRNLRFHSTRHYFNTVMNSLVKNEALRKVIGHSSPQMTEHYYHVSNSDLREVQAAQREAFPVIPFTENGETA